MPCIISYIKMPSAHQSTGLPWPLFMIISGAIYCGVPQRVYVLVGQCFANPKSVSLSYPSEFINIFSGFKSLYIKSLVCKCSKTSAVCEA